MLVGEVVARPLQQLGLHVDAVVVADVAERLAYADREPPGAAAPVEQPGLAGQAGVALQERHVADRGRHEVGVLAEVGAAHAQRHRREGQADRRQHEVGHGGESR